MSEKYEFIDAECATLPAEGDAPAVVQMCEWLGVSTSGFVAVQMVRSCGRPYDLPEHDRDAWPGP